MKRLLSLAMALVIICIAAVLPLVSASAETEKRDVFEMCSLYQARIDQFEQEYHIDCNTNTRTFYSDTFRTLSFDGGTASLSKDNEVVSLVTQLLSPEADSSFSVTQVYKAMMALSVLEYSEQDDKITIAGEYALGIGKCKNAVEKAMSIWDDQISVKLNEDETWTRLYACERIHVYSGNYDYYLEYKEMQHEDKMLRYVYLNAVSK